MSIRRCNTKSKLISFLSVPPYVPDEELIYMVQLFEKLRHDKKVHDKLKVNLAKGILNDMHIIDLELDDGVSLLTFFWLVESS